MVILQGKVIILNNLNKYSFIILFSEHVSTGAVCSDWKLKRQSVGNSSLSYTMDKVWLYMNLGHHPQLLAPLFMSTYGMVFEWVEWLHVGLPLWALSLQYCLFFKIIFDCLYIWFLWNDNPASVLSQPYRHNLYILYIHIGFNLVKHCLACVWHASLYLQHFITFMLETLWCE